MVEMSSFGFGPVNPDDPNDPQNSGDRSFGSDGDAAGMTPEEELFKAFSQFSQFGGGSFNPKAPGTPMISPAALRESANQAMKSQDVQLVGNRDTEDVREALDIANLWLDAVIAFPATSVSAQPAWDKRTWLDSSLSGWKDFVEPLAEGMASALSKVVGEMGVETILPIMRGFMGNLVATQLGVAVSGLAGKVTGANDVAIPLFSMSESHLIPQNIKVWGEGLDIPDRDIRYFLALREAAATRLFTHAPWLHNYLREAITAYGKGITIDVDAIQAQAESAISSGELDVENPESINAAISQGMFVPEQSAEQAAALEKVEMALALIEGWLEHVVLLASKDRLPTIGALMETQRRARATQSPTQQLFNAMLGLEVSPRKMRECAKFWSEVHELIGVEARDHRWEDPSLLPGSKDLSNPEVFVKSTTVPDDLSGLL